MKRLKTGNHMVTLDLKIDREYQYRYLFDGTVWINDWQTDKYVPSYYRNVENSVIVLYRVKKGYYCEILTSFSDIPGYSPPTLIS
jgi:hypothetical protein